MKSNSFFRISLLAFFCALMFVSCTKEGPMGLPGVDGKDGVDGTNGANGSTECNACHNEGTSLKAKQVQFEASAHSIGTYYSRGGQCAACHSTEGFLDIINHTSVDDIDNMVLGDQTPISCYTCHKVHQNYDESDWGLTNTNPIVETILGYTSPEVEQYAFDDMGDANMCLMCHQSRDRGNIPSIVSTDSVSTSSHWGPHYGVQGNVLHAKAGVNVSGSESYPDKTFRHDCIRCHMHEGDHTLQVNFNSCTNCHSDIEDDIEKLQHEVHDLLFELGAILADKGVMSVNMEDDKIVGYSPVRATISADDARAVWNYMVVYQDHSYGAHYPDYIKALLANTIEDLGSAATAP